MTESDDELLAAARALRDEVDRARYPLDVDGVDAARHSRRELLTQLDDYILPRLADLDAPLLAVVGGSTGAGKSTLVNTIAGRTVTTSGVLRPTTRASVLVHHPEDARWFTGDRVLPGLTRVSGGDSPHEDPTAVRLVAAEGLPPGIALLDAPDIDSVVEANRDLARQLLGAADLWIFLTTAARYADAVPWQILRTAAERGTSVAIVLDRVPQASVDEIADHLGEMLVERGLRHAPVFTITEAVLTDDELLPPHQVDELREWLSRLGQDAKARGLVVRRTLSGALDSLDARVDQLAEASFAQVQTVEQMRAVVTSTYGEALAEVNAGVADGSLLRGEVLARWQEYVGTGELLRQLESRVSWLRDRLTAAISGRPAPGVDLGEALQSGVAELITAHAEQAAATVVRRWRAVPGGAAILLDQGVLTGPRTSSDLDAIAGAGQAGERAGAGHRVGDQAVVVGTVPPGFRDEVNRAVRDWQGDILDLVRTEGKDRRTTARVLSFGVNAVGVVLMLVVFSQTMGLSGAEVGVAGGAAVLAQRLLEAIFGDQAVRTLAEKARRMLLERVESIFAAERARLESLVADVDIDVEAPERLRSAAAAIRSAR